MPCITIQSLELSESQKKRLAEKYIALFSEETGVPEDRIYLFFDGYQLDEAATGGKLFSNRKSFNIIENSVSIHLLYRIFY